MPISNKSQQDLLARHEAFLECGPVERPLVGLWFGGYYPAEQFPRGTAQWRPAQRLDPQDVRFNPFADDYESLYQTHRAADDDFFYVGSAYWGIPWLETILGCPVSVAAANCRGEAILSDPRDFAGADPDLDANPWLDVLLRFTEELLRYADGRFPVCPPLLRGPGDVACTMLSGTEFVTGVIDHPDAAKRLLDHIARTRLAVLRRLQAVLPAWHETHAAGGYPSRVWCRRTVAYYQEDSAALLNPRLFREFLLPLARAACEAAEVNFIHLHSACLYPLEMLLEDNSFDAIQINIDHAGVAPPLAALLPTLQRVQAAGRPLLLWGEFTPDDWQLIGRELSPVGLSLQPIVRDGQEPRRWQ
ncbi:MAG: uroporphyrinogen decarboxylase/cobalamine-independent methonine synthase family protein [Pirellulaceae bacterium]